MSWYNKVAWSEGLFLRPQLFQQQERYLEHLAHKRAAALSPFFWGFSRYGIDAESLSLGKVVLSSAAGTSALPLRAKTCQSWWNGCAALSAMNLSGSLNCAYAMTAHHRLAWKTRKSSAGPPGLGARKLVPKLGYEQAVPISAAIRQAT